MAARKMYFLGLRKKKGLFRNGGMGKYPPLNTNVGSAKVDINMELCFLGRSEVATFWKANVESQPFRLDLPSNIIQKSQVTCLPKPLSFQARFRWPQKMIWKIPRRFTLMQLPLLPFATSIHRNVSSAPRRETVSHRIDGRSTDEWLELKRSYQGNPSQLPWSNVGKPRENLKDPNAGPKA